MRRQRVDPAATAERALELIAIVDRQDVVLRDRRIREGPGRYPSICALGAARHNRHARGSGIAIRRSDPGRGAWASPARRDDRLLDGVLGSVDVAKDPDRDRHEPITSHARQAGECFLVAVLCELYERPLHPIDPSGTASRVGRYTYGSWQTRLVRSWRSTNSSPTVPWLGQAI
jgi:hypothetical protein